MRLLTCLLLVLVLVGTVFVSGFPIGGMTNGNAVSCAFCGPAGPSGPQLKATFGSNDGGVSPGPAIDAALDLEETARDLLDQALGQGLDVSAVQALLDQADALLKAAQAIAGLDEEGAIALANEAAELYEQAISLLNALLS